MKSLLTATLRMPPRFGVALLGADEVSETAERQPARPSPRSREPPPAARSVERRDGPAGMEGYSSVIEACL
ncbi:hypothetical protein ACIA8E_27110 [Streptomyces sp. NPDC051664]|uniref:hypothetical protein n=1 Tax=Streptomyces sp. NPDC051664 TaxID=3365668 RepID=UPI0037ACAAE8